jgi:hypothetical protein
VHVVADRDPLHHLRQHVLSAADHQRRRRGPRAPPRAAGSRRRLPCPRPARRPSVGALLLRSGGRRTAPAPSPPRTRRARAAAPGSVFASADVVGDPHAGRRDDCVVSP